jgi:hypothetical protein
VNPSLSAAFLLAAWVAFQASPARTAPAVDLAPLTISTEPVPLNPANRSETRLGDLTYAGGLALTSTETSRLHGLSDFEVFADGRLIAVGDEGDLLRARIVLDAHGRLAGLADAHLSRLIGPGGRRLEAKEESDAEGLAILSNGDMLISLERQHRILRYPADGGLPVEVPSPKAKFPDNGGMEAVTADPARGPGAYVVSGEDSGDTWRCSLQSACTAGPRVRKDSGFGVVSVRTLPNKRSMWLLRSYSVLTGNTILIRIVDEGGRTIDEQRLQRPMTVDNFEGIAAVPGPAGTIRFYLLSDDNFSSGQRTLLLAFDWKAR